MNSTEPGLLQSSPDAFKGAFVVNADRITERKSIVICGVTRGGTSFGASAFVRLGVPFWRPGEKERRRTFEHKALRAAFQNGQFDRIRQIAADFSSHFPVWGWKLPAIHMHFELIGDCVPNPHFVMLFKEPLSVAARKNALKGKETVGKMIDILTLYQKMVTLARQTEHPCLLVSYDRAMSNLAAFLADAASYAGISGIDVAAVEANIRSDQREYLQGWGQTREKRVALQNRST